MGREGRLAQEFPARLEQKGVALTVIDGLKGKIQDPLDELSYGKPIRQHVREFGAVMAIVACIIAYFVERKHHVGIPTDLWIVGTGLTVYALGVFTPRLLKPAWDGWMKFAHYLGIVMTALILVSMWTLIVIPMGVIVKLLRVKIMDMRWRAPVSSYWDERDQSLNDFKLLERQW